MIAFGGADGKNRDGTGRMSIWGIGHRIESPSYAEDHAQAGLVFEAGLRVGRPEDDPVTDLRAIGGFDEMKQESYLPLQRRRLPNRWGD